MCRGPLEGPSWVPLGSWSQWLVWAVGPGSGVPEASAALPGDGDAGVVPAAPGHWPGLPCAAGAEGGAHGKPSGLAPVLPAVLWVLHTQSSRLCAHEGRGHRSTAPRGQAGGEVWMPTRRPGEACVYTSCTQAQGQAQACRWAQTPCRQHACLVPTDACSQVQGLAGMGLIPSTPPLLRALPSDLLDIQSRP